MGRIGVCQVMYLSAILFTPLLWVTVGATSTPSSGRLRQPCHSSLPGPPGPGGWGGQEVSCSPGEGCSWTAGMDEKLRSREDNFENEKIQESKQVVLQARRIKTHVPSIVWSTYVVSSHIIHSCKQWGEIPPISSINYYMPLVMGSPTFLHRLRNDWWLIFMRWQGRTPGTNSATTSFYRCNAMPPRRISRRREFQHRYKAAIFHDHVNEWPCLWG